MDGAVLSGSAGRGAAGNVAADGRGAAQRLLPDYRSGARCACRQYGWRFPGLKIQTLRQAHGRLWGTQHKAARQALAGRARHGAPRAVAAGRGRAGEGVHFANGDGCNAACSQRAAAKKMDCARDLGRGARRAAHGAGCRAGWRNASAHADRKAAGHFGGARGLRRRTATGRVAQARVALINAANVGAARAGSHRRAACELSHGRH